VPGKQGRAAVTGLVTAELTAMAAGTCPSRPANRELDHEFDGFDDHMKDGDLAAARAELTAQLAGVNPR